MFKMSNRNHKKTHDLRIFIYEIEEIRVLLRMSPKFYFIFALIYNTQSCILNISILHWGIESMSDIYVNYNGKSGFSRAADKGALAGTAISYADFKGVSADIKSGSDVAYGITMSSGDVQDFIANYEVDSIFTDAEKG